MADHSSYQAPGGTWRTIIGTYAVMWSCLEHSSRREILGLVATLAGSVVTGTVAFVGAPYLLGRFVDGLTTSEPILGILLVGGYVAARTAGGIIEKLGHYLVIKVEARVRAAMGRRVADHALTLPSAYYGENGAGATSASIENGLHSLNGLVRSLLLGIVPVLLEFLSAAIVTAVTLGPTYCAIMVAAITAYAAALVLFLDRVWNSVGAHNEACYAFHSALNEGILNVEAVKCFGGRRWLCQTLDRYIGTALNNEQRMATVSLQAGLLQEAVAAVGLTALLLVALVDARAGTLTAGAVVTINVLFFQLLFPIRSAIESVVVMVEATAGTKRLVDLLSTPGETDDDGLLMPYPAKCLRLEGVNLRYPGRSNRALDGLTLEIPDRGALAIVGPSGGGKSSIARLLLRLYEPESGVILTGNCPLHTIRRDEVRRHIAIVPQDNVLFSGTVEENIRFACPNAGPEELAAAIALAGLKETIVRFPDGLHTMVGPRGVCISGGERQRICIARALLRRPSLLVLDEAASCLDPESERKLMTALLKHRRERATVVITHRLGVVTQIPRILVVENGSVTASGTHNELLARSDWYRAAWQSQSDFWAIDRPDTDTAASLAFEKA